MSIPELETTTDKKPSRSGHRIRPSEHALRIALKAAIAEGLIVQKISVIGGSIEIHFNDDDPKSDAENPDGLEKWQGPAYWPPRISAMNHYMKDC